MTTNTPEKMARNAMPTIRQASDDVLKSVGGAVDATREHANEALNKAENKVRELRGEVDPMVDMLATKAQKLARYSLDLASEAKDQAEQTFKQAAGATTRYVSEQPVRSILMAAAVGAAVALLVANGRERNRY